MRALCWWNLYALILRCSCLCLPKCLQELVVISRSDVHWYDCNWTMILCSFEHCTDQGHTYSTIDWFYPWKWLLLSVWQKIWFQFSFEYCFDMYSKIEKRICPHLYSDMYFNTYLSEFVHDFQLRKTNWNCFLGSGYSFILDIAMIWQTLMI